MKLEFFLDQASQDISTGQSSSPPPIHDGFKSFEEPPDITKKFDLVTGDGMKDEGVQPPQPDDDSLFDPNYYVDDPNTAINVLGHVLDSIQQESTRPEVDTRRLKADKASVMQQAKLLRDLFEKNRVSANLQQTLDKLIADHSQSSLTHLATSPETSPAAVSTQEEYMMELVQSGDLAEEDIGRTMDMINNPERLPGTIQHLVDTLNAQRVHPLNSLDPVVQRAWDILQTSLTPYRKKILRANEGYWTLYGSTIYEDDYVNRDHDTGLLVFKRQESFTQEMAGDVREQWDDYLNRLWTQEVGAPGTIFFVDMNKFLAGVDNINKGIFPKMKIDEIYQDVGPVSSLVTGIPLYTPGEKKLQKRQQQVMELTQSHPLFGALVTTNLQKAVDRRAEKGTIVEERRARLNQEKA